jgi:hypothetical protein
MAKASPEVRKAYDGFLERTKDQISQASKLTKRGLFGKIFGSSSNLFLVGLVGLGLFMFARKR